MLRLRTTNMQTLSALLLFVSVAAAFAFPSQGRQRRGAPGAGAGASATSGSFASSGSYGNGYGGAGGFAFPGPTAYGPSAFESAFRSYFDQMESLLAAQQAHAQALSNSFNAASANAIPNNNVDAGQGSFSSPGVGASQYSGVYSGHGGGVGYGYGGASGAGHGGGASAGAHGPSSFSGGAGSLTGSGLGGAAQGAHASLNVNDRGGFGQAQLFPDPDLSSRIAGDIAPLSGGSFGVFSSSSSSSHSDPSGKTHTFKQATVGVNDNGKVSTFSVKDP